MFRQIVNDHEQRLGENVMVQFITTQGQEWKGVERRYEGFKGGMWAPLGRVSYRLVHLPRMCVAGGDRGKEVLTFLFSTVKNRDFSATNYQKFVTGIRKAFKGSAVETIGSAKILFWAEI